jgi:Arc/MetJ-type ribon-helix-helix transcriptional regulator
MAISVTLTLQGELEKLVETYLRKGYAASRAEVIRMGLNKLREKEAEEREISRFAAQNANQDVWENGEDKVWAKYEG